MSEFTPEAPSQPLAKLALSAGILRAVARYGALRSRRRGLRWVVLLTLV